MDFKYLNACVRALIRGGKDAKGEQITFGQAAKIVHAFRRFVISCNETYAKQSS